MLLDRLVKNWFGYKKVFLSIYKRFKRMSNIFGGSFEIEQISGLDNTTYLESAASVGDAFAILDQQITVVNDSGLLLDPATHTISDQLNFLASNTNAAILGQYATIADLSSATTAINGHLDIIDADQVTQNTAITALETFVAAQPTIDSNQDIAITGLGLRLDTAEQGIQEHAGLIADNTAAINAHLSDSTAHAATQVYFLSPGGGMASRGFFLSGAGTTDSVYDKLQDTFTPTNAYKTNSTWNPIAFQNKIFSFSTEGGSFVSTDGGLNFSVLSAPWDVNNTIVTSCDVGEYTASGVFGLVLGLSTGEIAYTLDGVNFVIETTTFSNQILCIRWSNFSEWNFVVHNDSTLYGMDWTGVANFWTYPTAMPFEPTSIGIDANAGPIISSPTGTYYYDWHTELWTASTLLGTTQVYLSWAGSNLGGDYVLIAVAITGEMYQYTLDTINGTAIDAWVLTDTIVEPGTVTSITQYEPNKYLVTFGPAANALHQLVYFEYPFTSFHYQAGGTPSIRNLSGGCNAVYASTLPSTVDVIINTGTIATNDVDEAIRNLSTANTQVRAAGYQTSSNVSSLISSALTPYRTSSAQDTIDAGKYSTSNPSNYQTGTDVSTSISTALTPYRTSADQDTIDAGKYSTSNPSNYQTASQVSSAITSGTSGIFYPVSNPDNYVKLADANLAYYPLTGNPSSFETTTHANSTFATLTQFGYLAKPNMRLVSSLNSSAIPAPGQAYDTLANALVGISASTSIYMLPGTHTIASTLTIPAGVSIIGVDKKTTKLTMTANANASMFVCNAADISFQHLKFEMIAGADNLTLKQFELLSNNDTFYMDDCIAHLDSNTRTGGVYYNLHSTANAVHVQDAVFNIFEVLFQITGTSSTTSRNIYHAPTTSAADIHFESCQLYCAVGGCVETVSPGDVQLSNSFIQGTLFDISQGAGSSIKLGKSTVLFSANSNSLPFSYFGSSAHTVSFGDSGAIANGTTYMYKGTATSFNQLIPYKITKNTVILNMQVYCRQAPGAGETLAFTVMKNSVATALTCTLAGTAVTAEDVTHAVQFLAGDILAIRMVSSGNAAQDVSCSVDYY